MYCKYWPIICSCLMIVDEHLPCGDPATLCCASTQPTLLSGPNNKKENKQTLKPPKSLLVRATLCTCSEWPQELFSSPHPPRSLPARRNNRTMTNARNLGPWYYVHYRCGHFACWDDLLTFLNVFSRPHCGWHLIPLVSLGDLSTLLFQECFIKQACKPHSLIDLGST